MNYLDFGTPISFGYTAQYLPQKSVTRRDWKDSHATKFISAWSRAVTAGKKLRVPAIDKAYHAGGKQIGWAVLTEAPYKEALKNMRQSELIAEGGMCATRSEFIAKYFKGDAEKEVWVVNFDFQAIETETHAPEPVSVLTASRIEKNLPTIHPDSLSEIIPFFDPGPEIQLANRNLKILTSSKSDEHYTPENIISAAREVMGEIDLDPMSCRQANKSVKAAKFYTKETDGLTKPWAGRIWLNPAFSLANEAVSKLIQSHLSNEVTEAILLIKAAPDTARHQLLAALPFCEWRGRIKFVADGNSQVAPFAVLIFYLGNNFPKFREVFGRFGNIRLGQKQVDELEGDRRDLLAKVAQLQLQLAKKSEGETKPDRRMDWLEDDICDRVTAAEIRLKAWDIDHNIPHLEILSRQRIEQTARLEELKSLQKRIGSINIGFFGDRITEQSTRPKLEEMEGWRSEFAVGKLVQADDLTVEIIRYSRIKDEWICIARIREKGESYSEIGQNFYLRVGELFQDFIPYKFSEEKKPTYRLGSIRTDKELKSMFRGVKIPTFTKTCGTELTAPDNSIWQAFKERNTERCAIKWRCEVLPNGISISPRIAQKNDRLEAVANLNLSY
ncbi:MAG: hypothetical protein EAZ18_13020 [Oscillatoriales cyanobacterium]|nr:MAG: hypothetical protein EAZ18_13020 [Oscillatoriales cyanobacterium]